MSSLPRRGLSDKKARESQRGCPIYAKGPLRCCPSGAILASLSIGFANRSLLRSPSVRLLCLKGRAQPLRAYIAKEMANAPYALPKGASAYCFQPVARRVTESRSCPIGAIYTQRAPFLSARRVYIARNYWQSQLTTNGFQLSEREAAPEGPEGALYMPKGAQRATTPKGGGIYCLEGGIGEAFILP